MAEGRVSRLDAFCVMDTAGRILARGKVASDPEALFEVPSEHCPGPHPERSGRLQVLKVLDEKPSVLEPVIKRAAQAATAEAKEAENQA